MLNNNLLRFFSHFHYYKYHTVVEFIYLFMCTSPKDASWGQKLTFAFLDSQHTLPERKQSLEAGNWPGTISYIIMLPPAGLARPARPWCNLLNISNFTECQHQTKPLCEHDGSRQNKNTLQSHLNTKSGTLSQLQK